MPTFDINVMSYNQLEAAIDYLEPTHSELEEMVQQLKHLEEEQDALTPLFFF